MKRILGILLLVVTFSSTNFAQFAADDWIIGLQGSSHTSKYAGSFPLVSLDVTYFLNDRVSLNHTYAAGSGYFRAPASYAVAGVLAAYTGTPESLLLILLIPEGITYHVPLSSRSGFSPYLNLLGLEYNANTENRVNNWNMNAAVGAKLYHFIADDWIVNANIEMRTAYTEPQIWSNLNVGFGIGYRFEYDPEIF